MSFAQPSWAPVPPPKDRVYSTAQQGWQIPVHPSYAYAQPSRAKPRKDDYWDTELKENPLGLENMHIRYVALPTYLYDRVLLTDYGLFFTTSRISFSL